MRRPAAYLDPGRERPAQARRTSRMRNALADDRRVHVRPQSCALTHFCRESEPRASARRGGPHRRRPGAGASARGARAGPPCPRGSVGWTRSSRTRSAGTSSGSQKVALSSPPPRRSSGEVERAAVDVDPPDAAARGAQRQGDRDRPPAAADVEQVAGRAGVGCAGEQHGRARVEAVGGVDATSRAQREPAPLEGDLDGASLPPGGRLGGEVVVGRLAHQGSRYRPRPHASTTSTPGVGKHVLGTNEWLVALDQWNHRENMTSNHTQHTDDRARAAERERDLFATRADALAEDAHETDDTAYPLYDGDQLDREERAALRRVQGLSTELEDITEVEYRHCASSASCWPGSGPRAPPTTPRTPSASSRPSPRRRARPCSRVSCSVVRGPTPPPGWARARRSSCATSSSRRGPTPSSATASSPRANGARSRTSSRSRSSTAPR